MKKLFGLLTFILIGLISFCNAGEFTISGHMGDVIADVNNFIIPVPFNTYPNNDETYVNCTFISDRTKNIYLNYYIYRNNPVQFATLSLVKNESTNFSFVLTGKIYAIYLQLYNSVIDFSCTFTGNKIGAVSSNCPTCPTCDPQYTSQECQNVYGLVSSGLLASCENDLSSCNSSLNTCQANTSGFNELLNNCSLSLNACNSSLTSCLQANCPEIDYTGDLQWSNVYINDILHPGRQFVNINIPDYIFWDYSVSDEDFNIYVGSGYDQDYIDSVISINSYRPDTNDFTDIFVSGLTLIMPYIVILLFIVFIRKFIKRIFR